MGYGMSKEKNGKAKKPKNKKPRNNKKILNISIISFIIVLILVSIILYTYNQATREFFDKYLFRKDVYENNLPFITIDGINAENIYAYGKNILILEGNTLRGYNKMGQEEYTIDVSIRTPLFASSGNYLCLADKNGKRIYLISGKNIIWQKELEGEISNICINRNGYIAVSISDTSYKTIIETYDVNGIKLFRSYSSTANAIDIDISQDNKYLAIAEANFSGIAIQSSIKIISIEEAKKDGPKSIVHTHKAPLGDLIINIEYNNRGNLVCMYDSYIDYIKNSVREEIVNFSSEDILFADIQLNSCIAKVVKNYTETGENETELHIINSSAIENRKVYILGNTPQRIYAYDNIIAINLGTEILFINNNGWLKKRYNSSQEVKDIVISNDLAGIIYKNKIEIISL